MPPALTLASCSAYSTLKMEAICSSEISVNFQRTTKRYIIEDNDHCKNLKSYLPFYVCQLLKFVSNFLIMENDQFEIFVDESDYRFSLCLAIPNYSQNNLSPGTSGTTVIIMTCATF
jgi:hypothetical protein